MTLPQMDMDGEVQVENVNVGTLHLVCGLPCSGKTTFARRLEVERRALRLTPDEWIVRLFSAEVSGEALDAARDPVESVLWDLAARVLVLGVDVILDFGFWSRFERDDIRSRAGKLGARSELHFLNESDETLLSRLAERNADLPPATFYIEESSMREWMELFEPPANDELIARNPDG